MEGGIKEENRESKDNRYSRCPLSNCPSSRRIATSAMRVSYLLRKGYRTGSGSFHYQLHLAIRTYKSRNKQTSPHKFLGAYYLKSGIKIGDSLSCIPFFRVEFTRLFSYHQLNSIYFPSNMEARLDWH